MYLVVGLGNPGQKYKQTRHNAGVLALEAVQRLELPHNVMLAKPKTFMNNAGVAVQKLTKNLKLKIENLVIMHDDIDIPLGTVKVSFGRGSAGHKGVESIIQALGTKNFSRIRIGILPLKGKPPNVEQFVLQRFTKAELPLVKTSTNEAIKALYKILIPQ